MMTELELSKNCKKGSKGADVKRIQEWLCLHGHNLCIDSAFGPATEAGVRSFQEKHNLQVDGTVGKNTFGALVAPMRRALQPIPPGRRSLGQMVVAVARQHLKEHPREIGGQNRGPWVRLYMKGNEGNPYAWCAGFACWLLEQSCRDLGIGVPFRRTVNCDVLAERAKQSGIFVGEPKPSERSDIKPGWIFLNRKSPGDWTHTGIVTSAGTDVFYTVEGNTNDEGSREGYEVCSRTRGYNKKDFVRI